MTTISRQSEDCMLRRRCRGVNDQRWWRLQLSWAITCNFHLVLWIHNIARCCLTTLLLQHLFLYLQWRHWQSDYDVGRLLVLFAQSTVQYELFHTRNVRLVALVDTHLLSVPLLTVLLALLTAVNPTELQEK